MALTEIKRNTAYTVDIDLGADADTVLGLYEVYVSLVHDWGDTVVAETRASRVSAGLYDHSFSPSEMASSGIHKVHWRWVSGGDEFTQNDYANVTQQYIDADSFFALHEELEDEYYDYFDAVESVARGVIDTFCGQSFQFFHDKDITFDGSGTAIQVLPMRIDDLTAATLDAVDVIDSVEILPDSDWYVRCVKEGEISKFTTDQPLVITGDWGWPYVPTNVTRACDYLIEDILSNDRANYKYGVKRAWQDLSRFDFTEVIYFTTGNLDVDVLLMDYVYFTPDMV